MDHSRYETSKPIDQADADLLAAALADPNQFAFLYDRYVALIYRYCDRRLRDRELSEDATSQIFEKAFANLSKCPHDAFRPWLFTIAHNMVIDIHRRRQPLSPLDTAELIPDVSLGPEDVVLVHESARSVRELLEALSPDQRAVIELRLAGLNGTESMEVLGISREVLGSRTYRAMHRMRSLLEAAEAEGRRP